MSINIDKSLILNKIKEYYDFKTDTQFAKFLEIAPTTLSSWHKRNTFDHDLVYAKCVEINPDFILSGEGTINRNTYNNELEDLGELRSFEEKEHIYEIGNNQFIDMGNGRMQMFVPLVEQPAYAGYLAGWADKEYIEELPKISIIVEKHHLGTYRSFTVKGDSMNDHSKYAIYEGDIAVGRKIEQQHWKSKLHLKKWQNFAIVHEDGIIIKHVSEHDVEKGTITCVSLNPDKEFYPTRKIHLKDVYELYNITQVIRNF